MTHDTSQLPAEACSHFLADPVDSDVPEGAAVAMLFVAAMCVFASLAAIWLVAMVYA